MPTTSLALFAVLGCGLAFSALDLLRKRLTRELRPAPLLVFLALGQSPIFLLWWLVGDGAVPPEPIYLPLGLLSVLLNIVANLTMLESLRIAPLSLTIPLLSLTPVFTTLLAVPLLGQIPAARQWVGVIVVVVGAFILLPPRLGGSFRIERGSLLMVLTAFLWSLAAPIDRLAMDASTPSLHGLTLSVGVGLGVLVWLLYRKRAAELGSFRGHELLVAAGICVGAAALALALIAMTMVWVSIVETAKRAIGNVMAVILGRVAFGEAITGRKLIAVLVMASGVALVLW